MQYKYFDERTVESSATKTPQRDLDRRTMARHLHTMIWSPAASAPAVIVWGRAFLARLAFSVHITPSPSPSPHPRQPRRTSFPSFTVPSCALRQHCLVRSIECRESSALSSTAPYNAALAGFRDLYTTTTSPSTITPTHAHSAAAPAFAPAYTLVRLVTALLYLHVL